MADTASPKVLRPDIYSIVAADREGRGRKVMAEERSERIERQPAGSR